MAGAPTKLPVKHKEKAVTPAGYFWSPFETLRAEVDRLFDDFLPSSWRAPDHFSNGHMLDGWSTAPAVDLVEKEEAYEVTAECPGLDAKNVDVKFSNGLLTIRGEKSEEKEDKQKEYHLSERRYGSFQRSFSLPNHVDADKITATFEKGVLTVKLPKSPEAKKNERKIEVRAA
ncbi:Hsp20/alpha crystallin family protein [uncultured Agrobacterium sp.]|uniref:Hsp20/alpha crystallin family protein n=1 Tax=uncultured Agrobacterium sp. TaxID=157277 RepID=UPI0025EF3F9E|nr:Hsp20/alpha crystallin family protein [uncultured Agrobacterium sp.]